MLVYNTMKHTFTADQLADGGVEPLESVKLSIAEMQDFPTRESTSVEECEMRASFIAACVHNSGHRYAAVAGAAWLVVPLCQALRDRGITPVTSFSVRECVETPNPDGTVSLSYVFKHEAWVIIAE